MTASGEEDEAMRTMTHPIKWRLVSPIEMIEEKVNAAADTAGTIETKLGLAGRCTDPGLGSSGSMIKRQTRSSTNPAICTFTSTLKGKGNITIS
jgi:hypothetical protein